MIDTIVLLFAAGTGAQAPVCLASEPKSGEQQIVIARLDKSVDLQSKHGLRRIDCPEELTWTAEAARDQCTFYAHYNTEARAEFLAYYGISVDEVCDQGLDAAGLKVKRER